MSDKPTATAAEAIEAASHLGDAAHEPSPDGDQLAPRPHKTTATTITTMISELIETHMLKCDEAFPHPDDRPAHVISNVDKTAAWIQTIRTAGAGKSHLIDLALDDGTSFNIRVEEA